MKTIKEKILGCLYGQAIGDAFGLEKLRYVKTILTAYVGITR